MHEAVSSWTPLLQDSKTISRLSLSQKQSPVTETQGLSHNRCNRREMQVQQKAQPCLLCCGAVLWYASQDGRQPC